MLAVSAWIITCFSLFQCWCRPDWSIYYVKYRPREDEVRGSRGYVPDCENAQNPETCHGANRGEIYNEIFLTFQYLDQLL